jgi:dTDP-4-dehydrorhamnose 3,5-epimerase
VFDVIIDLRPESPTYKQWIAEELTEENRHLLYVPEGFAHGFQTLVDNAELFYQMSKIYAPGSEGGVRWNDPVFGIPWPERKDVIINDRDRNYPDFRD